MEEKKPIGPVVETPKPVLKTEPPHVQEPAPVLKTPKVLTEEEKKKKQEELKATVAKRVEERIEEKSKKKEQIHEQIVVILGEYRNLESEIPLSHEYWGLLNQYRGL